MAPPRVGDTLQIINSAGNNKRQTLIKAGDHDASTYCVVYVNDLARSPMFSKAAANFPPDSIIVREKLSSPSSTTPDLLAVMIKRAKGFNPRANDWEFLVITGDGKKIERREKTGACQECHASQSGNDFVFREPAP